MGCTITGHSLGFILPILSASCGSGPFKPTVTVGVDVTSPQLVPTSPVALQTLIIADNQISNIQAPHAAWSDNVRADTHVTRVAIRPPHMDLWGERILEWVLQTATAANVKLVIHLGDAANISCRSEYARFVNVMKRGGLRWYMAPGNHDSLMMGNWAYVANTAYANTVWGAECASCATPDPTTSAAMDKHAFLSAYIEAQRWTERDPHNSEDATCSRLEDADHTAIGVVCRRDEMLQWRSFILQRVSVAPDVTMILLDTTEFRVRPDATDPGGKRGGVGDDQLALVRQWMQEERAAGRGVILAGHHPVDALDKASKRAIEKLVSEIPTLAYFSAHTHEPASTRLYPKDTTARRFVDINFGSVLDAPMQFAYLGLGGTQAAVKLSVTITDIADTLEPACNNTWIATRRDRQSVAGYYTSYVPDGSYQLLVRQMFEMMRKDLAGTVALPADFVRREIAGESLLSIIPDPAAAAKVAEYERCQAIWAAEAERGTKGPWLGNDAKPTGLAIPLSSKRGISNEWTITTAPR